MKLKKISVAVLIATVVPASLLVKCSADKQDIKSPPPNECAAVQAKFAADVQPLIVSRCAGCHSTASKAGGIVLESYADISSKASAINDAAILNDRMPKSGAKLTAAQKAIIKCWISSGTPNN